MLQEQNIPLAKSFYTKAIDLVKPDNEEDKLDPTAKRQVLALASYLNAAMCCLKLKESVEAREYCESALKIDPNSEKAFFRRGSVSLINT